MSSTPEGLAETEEEQEERHEGDEERWELESEESQPNGFWVRVTTMPSHLEADVCCASPRWSEPGIARAEGLTMGGYELRSLMMRVRSIRLMAVKPGRWDRKATTTIADADRASVDGRISRVSRNMSDSNEASAAADTQ